MTKLEKIEEIIREYRNGSDADISAEDIIEGIDNVLSDDSKSYDCEKQTIPPEFLVEEGTLIAYQETTAVTLPDGIDEIGTNACSGCTATEISMPDSVHEIGCGAFAECADLKKIKLSEKIRTIGESAFSGCISLKEITIPDSVAHIGEYAFHGCDSLKNVSIPQGCDVDINAFDRSCNVTRRKSEPQQSRGLNI